MAQKLLCSLGSLDHDAIPKALTEARSGICGGHGVYIIFSMDETMAMTISLKHHSLKHVNENQEDEHSKTRSEEL